MFELECLMVQLFPESGMRGQPFTLKEIAQVLSECYGYEIPYWRVHRCWADLSANPHTREAVRQLPGDERFIQFSAAAARRIARRVVQGRLPDRFQQFVQHKTKPRSTKPRSIKPQNRTLRSQKSTKSHIK